MMTMMVSRKPRLYGVIAALACAVFVPALLLQSPLQGAEAVSQGTPDPVAAEAEYLRKLAAYQDARQQFEAAAQPYWNAVAAKRRSRNAKRRSGQAVDVSDYVLDQPPVYLGPPKPVDPFPETQPGPSPVPKPIPVVADLLRSAAEQFGFAPDRPHSEIKFKQAYARYAAQAGITRDQAVRIYGFEAGGNGKFDVQAGLEYDTPTAHAISTALGYNQLLNTNSVELMAEKGSRFLQALGARSGTLQGDAKTAFDAKLAIVRQMIVFSRSVADNWSEHERIASTPKGLAIHSLNLDIDIGPLLQTQKLLDSVAFAQRKGRSQPLTAAELEMMNLTGDGNGFDMINLPDTMRDQVPTSNFFQRSGYERNGVAIRNNTVAKLIAATDRKMDKETQLPGAKDLAAAFDN
jgi:hypothetical protein